MQNPKKPPVRFIERVVLCAHVMKLTRKKSAADNLDKITAQTKIQ